MELLFYVTIGFISIGVISFLVQMVQYIKED